MAAPIPLLAVSLLPAGAVAASLTVVSVAVRREDKPLTLASPAPGTVTRVNRRLAGAYARAPRRGGGPPAPCPVINPHRIDRRRPS